MPNQQTALRDRTDIDMREPRRFKVIIYNDDFTTMEFVVHVFMSVFFMSASEAEALLLYVDDYVSVTVGIYS